MAEIYQNTLLYRIAKRYIVWSFKQYYGEYHILGIENIPDEAEPVIYAPNHLNALMDALAILSLPPFPVVKVFLARSDLFNLPPVVARFLRFTKIMPAFRIRDGYENLSKNKESFDEADRTLLNNANICIMPEGNQGEERRIRPLVKGIFRIAFSALQKMPQGKTVKIIPVGIDLGDFIKPGRHLIINTGSPIDVSEYAELYHENPPVAINQLRERLSSELKKLTLDITSGAYYDCFESVMEIADIPFTGAMQRKNNTVNRFFARKRIEKILSDLEQTEPDTVQKLDNLCKTYKEKLQKVNLRTDDIRKPLSGWFSIQAENLLLIPLFLLSLPGFLFNLIPFRIVRAVPRWLNIKYAGFFSSVYYGFSIVTFPILYLIQAIALTAVFSLSWWIFLLLFPLQFWSGKLTMILYGKIKSILAENKKYRYKDNELKELMEIYRKINEIILSRYTTQ